jgi:hypothetical protein
MALRSNSICYKTNLARIFVVQLRELEINFLKVEFPSSYFRYFEQGWFPAEPAIATFFPQERLNLLSYENRKEAVRSLVTLAEVWRDDNWVVMED